jgi:phospholipase/lecithinase/hemolysin
LDGIHPNEEGQKLIAEKVLNYIKRDHYYLIRDDLDTTASVGI